MHEYFAHMYICAHVCLIPMHVRREVLDPLELELWSLLSSPETEFVCRVAPADLILALLPLRFPSVEPSGFYRSYFEIWVLRTALQPRCLSRKVGHRPVCSLCIQHSAVAHDEFISPFGSLKHMKYVNGNSVHTRDVVQVVRVKDLIVLLPRVTAQVN